MEKKTVSPSLFSAIRKEFGIAFLLGAVYKTLNDGSQFVGPLFIGLMIKFIQDPTNPPVYIGYGYAAGLFFGAVVGAIGECQYFQSVMKVGLHVRQAMICSIFQHSMRLTNASRKEKSGGEISNLITSDCEILQLAAQNLHTVWSAPLRIMIAVYMLYALLGTASLVGTAILIFAIPLQKNLYAYARSVTSKSLKWTDARLKTEIEVISAMNIIKCYCWEKAFAAKISEVRREEIDRLRTCAYVNAINTFMISTVPILVSVLTFATYTLLGNELTPAVAFSSLALFDVLKMPLFMLPYVINILSRSSASLQRLQAFLMLEDQEQPALLSPSSPTETVIDMAKCNYKWDPLSDKPVLKGVELGIKTGQLVTIIGSTGHGKSSLLSAILGEMHCQPGSTGVTIRGTVAYVPQQSWVFNASLRDNILFGQAYDPSRYLDSVVASQLTRDLELMASGDQTEMGEKGVNLSGGQKQRLSICRALPRRRRVLG